MKLKTLAIVVALFCVAVGAAVAGATGHGSHPDEKSNGLGSSRFPNHYAGPSRPEHP